MIVAATPAPPPASVAPRAPRPKKPFVRRFAPDRSQRVRRIVQFSFLALNLWLGVQFVLWVRYYDLQGNALYVDRPAGIDGWLPIAGLMNLKFALLTHAMPPVHPAAMVLAVVFLSSSLLLKKIFCSWLCPVGTLSELL